MGKRTSWEFKGLDGEPFMRIVKSDNDMYYQIFEYAEVKKNGGDVVNGWKPTGMKQWLFSDAVNRVRLYMLILQGGTMNDVKEIERVLKEVTERIHEELR